MSTKHPAAVTLGRLGGLARAAKLTPEQRSEAARKAAQAPRKRRARKVAAVVLLLLLAGCGSPTAPTAITLSGLPTNDPSFDATFFASFATGLHGRIQRPASLVVYVTDTDDLGQPVPPTTIAQAVEATRSLQEALGIPPDVRMATGANAAEALRAITIYWRGTTGGTVGGQHLKFLSGSAFIDYKLVTLDICGGLALTVVRHELMHAMGFAHTDRDTELMWPDLRYCDLLPSGRERYHAGIALRQPIGAK